MYIKYQDRAPDEIVEAVGTPALAQWFWDEWKARQYAELAAALKAQEEVSKQNFNANHRPHEMLGECTFRIARKLRDWIAKRFGWEAATNAEFCRELIRDNQDICFKPTQEKRAVLVKTRELPDTLGTFNRNALHATTNSTTLSSE